ncbi:hypothetical protein OAD62_03535 [Oceanihabitans sp.]|nr:hypothetical protein [Oceanihabitans sp.]
MKKSLSQFILLLTILLVFTSCNRQESFSHSDFEQNVFYQIFPSLVDSIHFDRRFLPPPPPPPIKDKNGNVTQLDSTRFKRAMQSWEIRQEKVSNDTTSTYIMVQDSVLFYANDNFEDLIDHFQNDKLISDTLYSEANYKIDLTKLKINSANKKFKYLSSIPKKEPIWKLKSDFYIAATMSFTRIQFDKSKSFGVLNASHSIGDLNGFGVIVFIKKDKYGIWIIDKISGTWIA